ncbi:MAG: energy transducer TonB [Candidatus Sulfopaludibacter sp.]|nr:energy transducer TonB [Candidatus Sulfopaludibacter sp.]
MILEPREEQGKFDLMQGLAGILVGLFGVSVVLFAAFAVGRAVAPPVRKPVLWNTAAAGVKPDSVYAGSPAAVTAQGTADSRKGDDIIYFAPTTADLPELVSAVQPALPKGAGGQGCDGIVKMRITIDAQGMPKNPAAREPSPCGLEYAALKAVMDWRFRPAHMDGKALPVRAWVQVHFR